MSINTLRTLFLRGQYGKFFGPFGNSLSCTETVCVYIMKSLYTDQQRPMLAESFFLPKT